LFTSLAGHELRQVKKPYWLERKQIQKLVQAIMLQALSLLHKIVLFEAGYKY
jgi:hypothetical protein